jgi:hypothetical protein
MRRWLSAAPHFPFYARPHRDCASIACGLARPTRSSQSAFLFPLNSSSALANPSRTRCVITPEREYLAEKNRRVRTNPSLSARKSAISVPIVSRSLRRTGIRTARSQRSTSLVVVTLRARKPAMSRIGLGEVGHKRVLLDIASPAGHDRLYRLIHLTRHSAVERINRHNPSDCCRTLESE